MFGAAIAREVVAQVVLRLQGMASGRGLVTRTDATVFTVLMPGFGADRARQAIERTMGSPGCIELDADQHEIVLVPDFQVHTFRTDSPPLAQAVRMPTATPHPAFRQVDPTMPMPLRR